jgi:shikimate dehydrogenase
MVAGIAGRPVAHSLSPAIHNAWIAAAGLDAIYAPFPIGAAGFADFVNGLRGGVIRGLNITIPFKEQALALADTASEAAARAGAANILVFNPDGGVQADNSDGQGLLCALESVDAFQITKGPAVVLGAGGAARGAVAALLAAGAPVVRVINRSAAKAAALAEAPGTEACDNSPAAFADANCLINATSLGLKGEGEPAVYWSALPPAAVVMDMVYNPLRTAFLAKAEEAGHPTADGLAMLIGQAAPAFESFFGRAPPNIDVRSIAVRQLEALG